jgi:hypothetical protein
MADKVVWGKMRTARLILLLAVVAGMGLAVPAQGVAKCHVSLTVSGGAGGAGTTVGDRVTLAASATGCGNHVHLTVVRVGLDAFGRHNGHRTQGGCGNPCNIHDRRTSAGGFDYQVFVTVGGKTYKSKVVRVVWAANSGGGSGGGGSGGGGGGGGGGTGGGGTGGGGGSGSSAATYSLVPGDTQVKDAQGARLTVSGMTADYQTQPSDGAQWHFHYSWTVPGTLVAGRKVSGGIMIADTISNVSPDQDLLDQINALAPDFAQAVQVQYKKGSGSASASMTYDYTLAADTTAPDFYITIGFVSSTVVYHYHRTS